MQDTGIHGTILSPFLYRLYFQNKTFEAKLSGLSTDRCFLASGCCVCASRNYCQVRGCTLPWSSGPQYTCTLLNIFAPIPGPRRYWTPIEKTAPPRFLERPAWRLGKPEVRLEALPVRSLFSRRQAQDVGCCRPLAVEPATSRRRLLWTRSVGLAVVGTDVAGAGGAIPGADCRDLPSEVQACLSLGRLRVPPLQKHGCRLPGVWPGGPWRRTTPGARLTPGTGLFGVWRGRRWVATFGNRDRTLKGKPLIGNSVLSGVEAMWVLSAVR